jgi:hypothetical protein
MYMTKFLELAARFRRFSKHFPKPRFQPRWDAIFRPCCCTSPLTVYGFETREHQHRYTLSLCRLVARPLLPFTVLKQKALMIAIFTFYSCTSPLTACGLSSNKKIPRRNQTGDFALATSAKKIAATLLTQRLRNFFVYIICFVTLHFSIASFLTIIKH